MLTRKLSLWPALAAALLMAAPASATVTIDWVTVGDPGNAADTTGFGSVVDLYRIGKFEVTNAQYAEFLNAVAATDTNALYSTSMGSGLGGITQSGSSGSFTYSAIAGREDMPVNFVSFFDTQRFANWLHNGQPTGAQDATTTEDGAYDFSGAPAIGPARKVGAAVFVPSEDEWYKAAYYDTGAMLYFDYPAGSDTPTACASPGATANTANCDFTHGDLSDVGSYTAAASPAGTFDQGGNVNEWNEAILGFGGSNRGFRGGSFFNDPIFLAASGSGSWPPPNDSFTIGFRVASPDPGQTDPGTDVVVEPAAVDENGDPVVGAPAITFEFDEVTGSGETTVTITETGPPPVAGLKLGNPPNYFDLDTTATFTGAIEICIDYSGIAFGGPPANLALFHDVGGTWVDVTTTNDTIGMTICGSVTSFSFFAIFEPTAVPALSPFGLAVLWSLLGLAGWRRLRA